MSEPVESHTILVVEDDPKLRQLLKLTLPGHGYQVVDAATGEDAVRLMAERRPDVVVLDLGLPGMDGIEVLRRLRGFSDVPILILSARGQQQSKVDLLDAGADDYLTKPFGFDELLARLRAAQRRASRAAPSSTDPVFRCGPLEVDRVGRRVTVDGEEIHLTPTEYELLLALANHAGRVVTHRQLLQAVWGERTVEDTGKLRVYMTYLRRKLEPDPGRPRFLTTQAGAGYRLSCD